MGVDAPKRKLGTRNANANANANVRKSRKGDDIAERLLALAAQVLRLLPSLPKAVGVANLVRQLERSAPAGGANFEEARGAESPADFVHKLRIALKEVRETHYWLRLIQRAQLTSDPALAELIRESDELVAILTASARTAKSRT
jgi:four helix bundle protein